MDLYTDYAGTHGLPSGFVWIQGFKRNTFLPLTWLQRTLDGKKFQLFQSIISQFTAHKTVRYHNISFLCNSPNTGVTGSSQYRTRFYYSHVWYDRIGLFWSYCTADRKSLQLTFQGALIVALVWTKLAGTEIFSQVRQIDLVSTSKCETHSFSK